MTDDTGMLVVNVRRKGDWLSVQSRHAMHVASQAAHRTITTRGTVIP